MTIEEGTLNESFDAFASSPDAGPVTPDPESLVDPDRLDSSAETQNTDKAGEDGGKGSGDGADQGGDKGKGGDDGKGGDKTGEGKTPEEIEAEKKAAEEAEENERFDKHPRFQELIKTKNRQAEEIQALTQSLNDLKAKVENGPESERDFDKELADLDEKLETGEMTVSEHQKESRKILKEQADLEREAERNQARQAQYANQIRDQFLSEHAYLEDYLKDREGLDAERQAHPLHDDLSAALVMHIKKSDEAHKAEIAQLKEDQKAAIDEAVKEATEKIKADYAAKRHARSLTSGPSAPGDAGDHELKDTAMSGGVVNTLAARLKRARAGA